MNSLEQTLPVRRMVVGTLERVRHVTGTSVRWRRLVVCLLVLQVTYYVIFIALSKPPYDLAGNPLSSDLFSYLIGANTAVEGDFQNLYDVAYQDTVQSSLLPELEQPKYTYFVMPPLIALIYAPLAALPYMGAVVTWLAISFIALSLGFKLVWDRRPRTVDLRLSDVLLVGLSIPCVFDVLYSGQSTGLWLLLIAGGYSLLVRGKDEYAGILFGLGLLKPQLFILFPILFLVTKHYRALLATVATGALITLGSLLLVGLDGASDYVALLQSDEYLHWNADLVSWKMLSLPALVRSVTGFGVEPGLQSSLLTIVPVTLAATFTVWIGRKYSRAESGPTRRLPELVALTVLTTFVLTPHVLLYDGVLLIVPILAFADRYRASALFRVSFVVAYLLAASTFLRVIMFIEAPAPLNLLATPITAIPIALMWIAAVRVYTASSTRQESKRNVALPLTARA